MSNMLGQTKSRDETRTLPKGEVVGTYTAYLDAQKAVDYLADHQFPVQNVSILGNDLKTVERVTGRLSYPRVALAGAATGAWFGLFVGVVLMLFGGTEAYTTLLSSMALGAGFWMLFGVITYALQRGKRDFTSTSQVVASNYQVIVAPETVGEARRLLQQLPMQGGQGAAMQGSQGAGWGSGQPGSGGPGYNPGGGPYGQGQQGAGQQGGWGQAPERPANWEDPYQNPSQDQGNGSNVEAQPAPTVRRGRFQDLPDGRPQYGVRLPAAQQAQPGQQTQPGQHPQQGQPTGNQSPEGEQTEQPPADTTGHQDSDSADDRRNDR